MIKITGTLYSKQDVSSLSISDEFEYEFINGLDTLGINESPKSGSNVKMHLYGVDCSVTIYATVKSVMLEPSMSYSRGVGNIMCVSVLTVTGIDND